MLTVRRPSAARDPRSRFSLSVALGGLLGIVALFLPFTWNTTPIAAVDTLPFLSHGGDPQFFHGLWRLGLPFVLAVPVTVGTVRWIISGRLEGTERVAAYLAALLADAGLLSMYLVSLSDGAQAAPSGFTEWFTVVFPWVGSLAGACLLLWNTRRDVPEAVHAIAAMQIVYVVGAITCLVAFAESGFQVGAYAVALTTLVYLFQIIAVSVSAPGLRTVASMRA